MNEQKQKIISDICPFYKEYGTCGQCNKSLVIDDEPCYWECMANAIIASGYRKQSEGEWIRYPHGSGIYCSLCKHKRRYRDINDAFCPNCGASMEGGAE